VWHPISKLPLPTAFSALVKIVDSIQLDDGKVIAAALTFQVWQSGFRYIVRLAAFQAIPRDKPTFSASDQK
jgi:hypothetical protein